MRRAGQPSATTCARANILSASARQALAQGYERKFNPNHDPADGRFTSGPGSYPVSASLGELDMTKPLTAPRLTSGLDIGGLSVAATGSLTVDGKGGYAFTGWIGATGDEFVFHPRDGRSEAGNLLNDAGSLVPGKPFHIYIIGTRPLSDVGSAVGKGR